MDSLKERFKAKLARKPAKTPGPSERSAEDSPAKTTPHAEPYTKPGHNTSGATASIPERLWNRAYDQAKESDASIVDAYEKILSARLHEAAADISDASLPTDLELQQNEIATHPEKRRLQMRQLVEYGLRKTENDAKSKKGVEEGIQSVVAVKSAVDKAIQVSPEAAVPWVGACIALEVGALITAESPSY